MMRYFVGFIVTIGLIILLILLLIGGGSNKPKVPTTHKTLDSYAATDATVRLTIDGPINAAQNHDEIQITVGRDQVVYDQIKGYDGSIVNQQSFSNSQAGYAVFLHALSVANFTQGNTSSSLRDERGYCPLGDRYIVEVVDNGQDSERFWTTSCSKPRSYEGNTNLTLALFRAQVPGYANLINNLHL